MAEKQWVVVVECKTLERLVCRNCTEAEARINPYMYAIDKEEIDNLDWVVVQVDEDL